jgi:hypothetical protein
VYLTSSLQSFKDFFEILSKANITYNSNNCKKRKLFMTILIPVDINDYEEAKITLLDDVKHWILIEFFEGKVIKSDFFVNRQDISVWIDVVIVKNEKEYVWQFMEEGMAVLVAHTQMYVEDVMEAYLFKELHDMNLNI